MSIASQLTALEGNISNAYDMVAQRGGTVPARKNMENLDDAIATIPSGGSFVGIPRAVVDGSGGHKVYGFPTTSFSFSLPSEVTKISNYGLSRAFYSATTLTSVDMSHITTLEQHSLSEAFLGCSSLTTLNLSGLSSVGVYAMSSMCQSCYALTTVSFGSSLTRLSLNSLGFAFQFCTSLASMDLRYIEYVDASGMERTFYGCTSLASVNLSSLQTIARYGLRYCFYDCTSLASVTFASLSDISAASVFYQAFYGCTGLTAVSFPALTTTSFGNATNQFQSMLAGCSNVTVHFPSAIQSTIGSWADVTNGFGGTNTTVLFDL